MDSFPFEKIGTDEDRDDMGLTMPEHKKADKQKEEGERGEAMVAQRGNEEEMKVNFRVNAEEEESGTTSEEEYEEAIRDATNATPQTPYPSPQIKKSSLAPEAANPDTHPSVISLTEDDFKELDIFWECCKCLTHRNHYYQRCQNTDCPDSKSNRAEPTGHKTCEYCRTGFVVWGDLQHKWVKNRLTVPDFLFLKNRQRNSEQAPTRRASVLNADKVRRRAERGVMFVRQTPIASGTTSPTNGADSSDNSRPPMGSWSPGLPISSGASTPTSSGTITPLSLEITTPPTRPVIPASPRLPRSSKSQRRAMNPESLAEFGARARVVIPTNAGAQNSVASGPGTPTSTEVPTSSKSASAMRAATDSQFAGGADRSASLEFQRGEDVALRSEVPMSSHSEVPDIPDAGENAEVAAGPMIPKPPRLGVRVWSSEKYMKTS